MSARTKARKRALDVLYQADISGQDAKEVLAATQSRSDGPMNPYTAEIINGVEEHRQAIDNTIGVNSRDWTLARMPAVDRNLLRIATWELLYQASVPTGVAIDEAVTLAGQLSTDDSGSFVNGVLSQIATQRDTNPPKSESDGENSTPNV